MHKYKYTLNGVIYFICLTPEDKELFEDIYGVHLEIWTE